MSAIQEIESSAVERFNPDQPAAVVERGMLDVASSRQAQEVQAAMVVAKRFPRNENDAFARIMRSCKRKSLAECAVYEYPRGGEKVTGPSIRLAEELARSWGNINFGVAELEQRADESIMEAYCWDLETNTRQTKVFTVKHERHTKRGAYKLTDPRDVYELTANQGARRVRACILGVIPGDVVEAAVAECEKTLAGGNAVPLADRIRQMAAAFSEYGVTSAMLEAFLGHSLTATSEGEMVRLRKRYQSIKDGMASAAELFPSSNAAGGSSDESGTKAAAVADKIRRGRKPKAEQPAVNERKVFLDAIGDRETLVYQMNGRTEEQLLAMQEDEWQAFKADLCDSLEDVAAQRAADEAHEDAEAPRETPY